jgi:hypothetical protein
MVELLKKIIHKSLGKLCSVQTVNAKCGMITATPKKPFEQELNYTMSQ